MKDQTTGILLLAGRGSRIADVTTKPKCLLEINGKTLLQHHLDTWLEVGLRHVVVVLGYEAEQIENVLRAYDDKMKIKRVFNEDYIAKGNTYSLYLGIKEVSGGCLIFDGDLIYSPEILASFIEDLSSSAFLVGEATLDDIECAKVMIDEKKMIRMTIDKRAVTAQELSRYSFAGEAIGIIKFTQEETQELLREAEKFLSIEANLPLNWEHLMNQFLLVRDISISRTVSDQWVEVDNNEDYQKAIRIFKS